MNYVEGKNEKYNLEKRTAKFAEDVIDFINELEKNEINRPLISQIIRSCTSIGANYMEATAGESDKDFRHKIAICKKESKETCFWLQVIAKANNNVIVKCRKLWKESHELVLIFSKVIITCDKNNKQEKK